MNQSRSWRAFCLVLLFIFPPIGLQAQSVRTISRGLDQLSAEASLIVRGHVTSAKIEPHPQFPNLTTVLVSMDVAETLKGQSHNTLQFRQYIWDIRDKFDAAHYAKGQELLLMLGPVSQYGLRSPVGLDQGRFHIFRDAKGRASAVNGKGNAGLFDSVEKRATANGIQLSSATKALVRRTRGPVPLGDLEDAIRAFGRTK